MEREKKAEMRSESKGSIPLITKMVLPRGHVHSGVQEHQSHPETPWPPLLCWSQVVLRNSDTFFCPAGFSLRLLPNPDTLKD